MVVPPFANQPSQPYAAGHMTRQVDEGVQVEKPTDLSVRPRSCQNDEVSALVLVALSVRIGASKKPIQLRLAAFELE